MNTIAQLKRQRPWITIAIGLGTAAALGVSRLFTPQGTYPVGYYVVLWLLVTATAVAIVQIVFARAIGLANNNQALLELSLLGASARSEESLLNAFGNILNRLYGLQPLAYWLRDGAQGPGRLQVAPGSSLPDEHKDAVVRLMEEVAHAAGPRYSSDLTPAQQAALKAVGAGMFLLVPLTAPDASPEGVACLTAPRPRRFAASDLKFMATLGTQLAHALVSSSLARRYQEALEDLASYQELAASMTYPLELNKTQQATADCVVKCLRADGSMLLLMDPESGALHVAASHFGPGLAALAQLQAADQAALVGADLVREGSVRRINAVPSAPPDVPVNREAAARLGVHNMLVAPLHSQGNVLGAIAVLRASPDIAFTGDDERRLALLAAQASVVMENGRLYALERERVRQLDELVRFRSLMLYNLSHELRMSLTSLKAATDLLLAEPGIEPGSEYFRRLLQSISRNAARQTTLVANIVDMANLENATLTLNLERVDVGPLVAEASSLVGPLVSQKGQTLTLSVPSDLPPLVADRQRLSQVLVNLLTNARNYAPAETEIVLAVEKQGDRMVFSVSDSGPGIPVEERQRVFEPFYRIQGRADWGVPGTGLGLAISRSLVELHGGSIWIEDSPTGGARVVFSLPIEGPDEGPGN